MTLSPRRRDDGPDAHFERLRRPFAEQLERWPDFFPPVRTAAGAATPLVDVEETDDSYLLEVELPGVGRSDIDLRVEPNGRLTLSAERRERARVGLLRHRMRSTGRLALALQLPVPVLADEVTADLQHGVLHLRLPKAAGARRRRIAVTRASQP